MAFVVGAFAWLLVTLRIRTKQRDKVALKQQQTEKQLATVVKVSEQKTEIAQAVEKVRQQAREVDNENFQKRTDRPTGDFGDKRLR